MQNLYTIYDAKAQTYTPPFIAPSDAFAMRQLASQLSTAQASELPIVKYPGDFSLFCVACWDELQGLVPFDKDVPKRNLGTVLEILSAFQPSTPVRISPNGSVNS